MQAWPTSALMLFLFAMHVLPSPCANSLANSQDSKQKPGRKGAQSATQVSTLTGCVDEKESGHYVLIDDAKLSPIAELKAEGFPNEGFAKHLGQKVTVHGKRAIDGDRVVIAVRKIETVSETCAPARPQQ